MIILAACAAAGALLLVVAGFDHVRAPAAAAGGLAALGRIGRGRERPLAVLLGVTEIAVGVAVLVVLAAPVRAGWGVLAVQGALYLGFLGYLVRRYRRHDRGDCACSGAGARVGAAGMLRAGALGIVSLAAAVGHPAVALPDVAPTGAALALGIAAGVVLCVLCYALPPAVDGPARSIGSRRYG